MAGRESSYVDRYAEQAYRLCLLGMTNEELADFFQVATSTIHVWIDRFPEFSDAIKRGKEEADSHVAEKLWRRATGYEHEAVKIFQYEGTPVIVPYTEHYPPDTQAASLWLRNRQPDKWRDRREVTGAGGKDLIPEHASDSERLMGAFMALLKTTPKDAG